VAKVKNNLVKYQAATRRILRGGLPYRRRLKMRLRNDLNLDTEAYLLLSIYRTASPIELSVYGTTDAMFVEHFDKAIRGAGRVLQWLGLATADDASPLGHRPSHELMHLLARQPRRTRSKKLDADAEDQDVFDLIFEATLGESYEYLHAFSFVMRVFRHLGLAKEGDGEFIPTVRLRRLAAQRRLEERERRDEERAKSR
jgi:hypothetical protein